jgi:hypothetical protein
MKLKMKAYDFDEDGLWSPGGGEQICLLGLIMDIPEEVTYSREAELEEMLMKRRIRIGDCIGCGERTTKDTVIFATSRYRMLILWCCDRVIWTTEDYLCEVREETGWKNNSMGV